MTHEATCAKCSTPLAPETTVPLWDGKCYCRDCVEEACHGLAEYALSHDALEEKETYSIRELFAWDNLLWFGIVNLMVFGHFGIALARPSPGFESPQEVFAFFFLIALVVNAVVLVLVMGDFLRVRYSARTLIVKGGVVTVRKKSGRSREYLLDACKWATKEDMHAILGRLYVLPPKVFLWGGKKIKLSSFSLLRDVFSFACGKTEEKKRIWVGFLTLAGVPRTNWLGMTRRAESKRGNR